MEKFLFTVYDSAAAAYLDPFIAPSTEFAIREFRRAVNQEGHQFNTFPEDYTLFQIGSFDPLTATLKPTPPTSLGVAITFKEQISLFPNTKEDS